MVDPSPVCVRNHSSVFSRCREGMGEEDSVENQYQEGYRSLREMLQGPVRDTVRARSLAEFESADGFLNLLTVG